MPLKTLVIVESPAKAKTIQKYLGAGYRVAASVGHIRDLPATKEDIPEQYAAQPWARLGIDVAGGFKPLYVVPKDKRAKVADLRKLAKEAEATILATDGDREGEAIGWHLARELGLKNPQRMEFYEITPEAIQHAVSHLRPINYALVGAQESRRLLDRLYGYGVSPALWRTIGPRLSAGRVQSAALVSLAHRETLRMAHVTAPFIRVTAQIQASPDTPPFRAVVMTVNGQALATAKDFGPDGQLKPGSTVLVISATQGQQLVDFLQARGATITATTTTPYTSRPPAPFITSTLQQAGASLQLDPKTTMKLAQTLYEQGFITYMRTDSPALSEEAVTAARAVATAQFGPALVLAQARVYGTRNKNAQEAHEGIRPSGRTFKAPEATGLAGDELAVYDLIYRRTVACQMIDLQGEKTVLNLSSGKVGLEASGRVVTQPGYTRMYRDLNDSEDEAAQPLPAVQQSDRLTIPAAKAETVKTPAPGRFTQAKLVQALEKAGVGRPSTYAAILDTLTARGYARIVNRQLVVTWLGLVVAAYLQAQFGEFVGVTFTARMEADLDRIAAGDLSREDYLNDIWLGHLEPLIGRAQPQALTLPVPKVPGAVISVRAEQIVLVLGGKAVPLPPELSPDALTPELAAKLMSGAAVTRPVRPKASQNLKSKKQRTKKPTSTKSQSASSN